MKVKRRRSPNDEPTRWYRGADIPMRVIRRYARRVADRFKPDKIILFGSYAYGSPHTDSDVDLLVIMPTRNELDQAFKIRCEVPAPFPMDLLVRTPKEIKWRLEESDLFHTKIVNKGKPLYEKKHARMGRPLRSIRAIRAKTQRSVKRCRHGVGLKGCDMPAATSWASNQRLAVASRRRLLVVLTLPLISLFRSFFAVSTNCS
jgi:uncharacterized protein